MSFKLFVNTKPAYDDYLELLQDLIDKEHDTFEKAQTTEAMWRAQGALKTLRRLQGLRDMVNAKDK